MIYKERIVFFLSLLIFSILGLKSQTNYSISGTIIDSNSPVEFVNVALITTNDTSRIVKVVVTDSSGKFVLNELKAGNYFLKTQIIGFLPARIHVSVDSFNPIIDLKNISLKPDNKLLSTIDIVSHKDLIKKTPQGFIILTKDNLTQAGGTATDLLKNTPTVVVDPEGGITIRGKSPLILINGRNSGLSSTDRIPASSIESIEIINNPTAQYDADAEGGIINIKLKKNIEKGTNGSVALGGGFGDKGRVNSSLGLNHHTKKWNLATAYDNRFAGRTRKIDTKRTNFDLPAEYYLIQNRHDNRYEQTQNLKFNIDFSPNEKNNFSLELIGNTDGVDNDEFLTTLSKTKTDSFNFKNTRRSIELQREKTAEIAFNYSRKFNNPKKYFGINITSGFDFDTENTDITTQSLYEDNNSLGSAFLQRTHNYQNSNVSNFRLDYGQPLGKKGLLEMGYKAITRYTDADFVSQYYFNNEYVTNPLSSNRFNFQEQIHAAYLQYKGYFGHADSAKWKYDIGIRCEQVNNAGKVVTNNISVKNDYFNFFPTGNLAYYINQSDFLKISFSRRINRPGLDDLNPFTDITDSLNPHSGNPYLKPELANSLEAGYNKEWQKISLTTNVFYRYSTNIIRSYVILKDNGVALIQPMNFGNATTYGAELIASVFPVKFWSTNISASCYQQNIDGSNISSEIANNVFSWYGKLINNFTLWKGSKLQIMGNYNSPVGTPQGQKVEIYYVDLGFQQKIFKGKGALGLVVTDVFNTQIKGYRSTTSSFQNYRLSKIDTRAVLLTFGYSFGTSVKDELIENKFSNE